MNRRLRAAARAARRVIRALLWAVIAVALGVTITDFLIGAPWYATASAASVAIVASLPLGRPARCGHFASLYQEAPGLGYSCRRPPGSPRAAQGPRGALGQHGHVPAERGRPPMNQLVTFLQRLPLRVQAVLGLGPRCRHEGQLLPGYGDIPVYCQRRAGHRGFHKDGIAVWTGDETGGAHHNGGPS